MKKSRLRARKNIEDSFVENSERKKKIQAHIDYLLKHSYSYEIVVMVLNGYNDYLKEALECGDSLTAGACRKIIKILDKTALRLKPIKW